MTIAPEHPPTPIPASAQDMDRTTSISFDYSVSCGQDGVPHFEFTVDGHASASNKILTAACGVSGLTTSLILPPGPHTLRWTLSVESGDPKQGLEPRPPQPWALESVSFSKRMGEHSSSRAANTETLDPVTPVLF